METKISIIQFLFSYNWKVLSDSLGANPALTAHKFSTSSEILKYCSTEENCLVIANISSKDDLIQLATFVKAARRSLKGTVLKIVVVNATENKQFERAIQKIGSIEILEPTVNVKALRFKMDFWMKAMRGQAKKLGALNQKTLEQATALEGAADAKVVNILPPLECESDIWILSRESDCKKIISRWMVKMMGPSPYVGTWNDVPGKPNVWAFQIKKAFVDMFISGEGTWFFKGDQKPEFNWQENRWMFTGENLELFFFDSKVFSRLKIDNRVLTLTGNSLFAKTKENLIVDSFNKDLVFKNEAEILKGNTLDFENEGDIGGKLEGKVKDKTESAKGNLEGKIKDHKETEKGNLTGKIKDQEESASGDLKGKIKESEASTTGHMSGKLKKEEDSAAADKKKHAQSNEEISSNWGGKVARDEAAAKTEKEHKQHNDKLQNNWGGKISKEEAAAKEEKEHKQHNDKLQSNWGGKIAKEEAAAKEEKEHKQHNDKLQSNWGGKLENNNSQAGGSDLKGKNDSADRLGSHWGGKNTSDEIKTDGVSTPGNDSLNEGSLLDLKKTENEHQTHYKNHNEATKYEADATRKNQYQDSDEDALGGKSSTDKLSAHYGGRKNSETSGKSQAEKKKSPFADLKRGKTEKISSHMASSKRPAIEKTGIDFDLDSGTEEIAATLEDLQLDSFEDNEVANVLPFAEKAKASDDIDQITESSHIVSFIIQNGKKFECKLDDYFDNNVILVCKGEGLKNSETARLDISLNYQSKKANINCDGSVMSIDQDGNGEFFVTVEVSPGDAQMFDQFMVLLKSRQENIDTFLMKVKGY